MSTGLAVCIIALGVYCICYWNLHK